MDLQFGTIHQLSPSNIFVQPLQNDSTVLANGYWIDNFMFAEIPYHYSISDHRWLVVTYLLSDADFQLVCTIICVWSLLAVLIIPAF